MLSLIGKEQPEGHRYPPVIPLLFRDNRCVGQCNDIAFIILIVNRLRIYEFFESKIYMD